MSAFKRLADGFEEDDEKDKIEDSDVIRVKDGTNNILRVKVINVISCDSALVFLIQYLFTRFYNVGTIVYARLCKCRRNNNN